MNNFLKIAQDVDVLPLLLEVQRQEFLWNKNPARLSKLGPHSESDDIVLRYKDETENIKTGDWSKFCDPHFPEWYKSKDFLPSAQKLIFDLMYRVKAEILGGVLLYRVRPGKNIHPHTDRGWHPSFYEKFNICLQSNGMAGFQYDNEIMYQKMGDIHHFRNDVNHSVFNEGDCDHVVMTVCVRLDNGYRAPWSPEGFNLEESIKNKVR